VTLEILLYTIARVNFGVEIHDRKGLHGPVRFNGQPLENWDIRAIDFDADGVLPPLTWKTGRTQGAAFWRGSFDVAQTGDTFLDMSGWGQGIVWINGRCLGRYWSIGPTQTMYLPGPWLQRGRNEVVVLDLTRPAQRRIAGLKMPILDQLHPERDLPRPPSKVKPALEGVKPVHEGEFARGSAVGRDVRAAGEGRQFCLESLDAFDGKQYAAVAELALLGVDGKPLNQSNGPSPTPAARKPPRKTAARSTPSTARPPTTGTRPTAARPPPRRAASTAFIIDLGHDDVVAGMRYTPRQGPEGVTGRIALSRLRRPAAGKRLSLDLAPSCYLAVLAGREAGGGLELAGEGGVVAVAAGLGDFSHAGVAVQHARGGVHARLDNHLARRQVEDAQEVALDLRHRHVGDARQLRQLQGLAVLLVDHAHRRRHFAVGGILYPPSPGRARCRSGR
jgi:hypothetical protein